MFRTLWTRLEASVTLALFAAPVLLAMALPARPAEAGNLDEFGFGARPSAMGGAMTGLASDWTATWYNPAGLVLSHHVNTGAGFQYAGYALRFDSERGSRETERRATRVQPLSAFTAGVSSTIALDEPDRLAFGIGLFLPTRQVVEIEGKTPSAEPEWAFYGSNADRAHILPAVAVKIVDGLSFGIGVNVFAVADGALRFDANLTTPVAANFKLKLKPDAGASAGLFFNPHPTFSAGLTYRTERSFKVKLPVVVNVQGITLPLTTERLTLFEPHQVSLGAAWSPLDGPFLVCVDLTYMNWAAYDDVFLVVSSPTFPVPQRQRSNFEDTVIARLGFEYQALDWLALRTGYFYRPSPADDATGPATILDNDKHVFTLGAGFTYDPRAQDKKAAAEKKPAKPAEPEEKTPALRPTIDVEVFAQYHFLVERSASRPATDPLGNIDYGGGIWNLGLAFLARF